MSCLFDAGRLLRAIEFAAEKHRDQRRKGSEASPYINHPIRVASLIANVGKVEDLNVLIAAVLHDTIEDTQTTPEELVRLFGTTALEVVLEVTDDKVLPKQVRKQRQVEHAPHLSTSAKVIKLADKIVNIQDICNQPPSGWTAERKQEYFDWAANVVDGCRGVNTRLENHFDQALMDARKKLASTPPQDFS
ncbi:MAG: phosphohydrolase [Desulfuromonas sp.]|nr:MAG: phosphohydrolase [Desulfuromonas sp.]